MYVYCFVSVGATSENLLSPSPIVRCDATDGVNSARNQREHDDHPASRRVVCSRKEQVGAYAHRNFHFLFSIDIVRSVYGHTYARTLVYQCVCVWKIVAQTDRQQHNRTSYTVRYRSMTSTPKEFILFFSLLSSFNRAALIIIV